MSKYPTYLQEIEDRKAEGLHPKPVDDAALLNEIIDQIKDPNHPEREASLNFFIYNVLPGTTVQRVPRRPSERHHFGTGRSR